VLLRHRRFADIAVKPFHRRFGKRAWPADRPETLSCDGLPMTKAMPDFSARPPVHSAFSGTGLVFLTMWGDQQT
jgi:hypothetical protein